jgi:Aerotolerance regulator N-terminal/von Willebrand factor type A domain/CARDB
MLFLNPAVLFGLLAASIPVLIHLLNLRKLKRIEFSTLAFLKELQKNKIRKIKLKQWLLLALRVLIILFLVMAFARPTIKGIAIGGTTSAAKTTAVFILDDTFSMSVVDANGSYLNQAKSMILELLKELQEGDDAALVLVSDKSNREIKTTGNLSAFEKEVNSVQMSYASGLLHNAIVKAAKILGESKNFNKEIYILSDFQSGRLYDTGTLSDLSELLNENVRLYTINYSGKEVFNLGIDRLKIDNQIFEKDKPVNFSVTVTNYSNRPVDNTVVSLYLNGKRSAQASSTIGAGESRVISMQVVPEQFGYIDVTAEIEDDDILQDNKRFTNFYIPDKIPVIIFTDDPADAKFINLALTAGDNQSSIKITNKNISQLSSIDLNQYDAILIIGSRNITGIDRLNSYIKSGGCLILMPGSASSLQEFQSLTSRLSLPVATGTFGKINSVDNPESFDKIEFNHPIFKDIFANRNKEKVESPDIYHSFKIATEGKGINIITLMDGSSFLSEYKIGSGKVLLMNTAPVLSWSNLPLKGIFVPLMNKAVYYLGAKDNGNQEYLAGDEIEINLANNLSPQIKIDRPDKTDDFLNLDKNLQNNYISYDKTKIVGNYKVFSGSRIIDEIAVNTDPRESVTKYLSETDFNDYLKKIDFKGKHIVVAKNENPAKVILQSRFGSELWKYFILIALLLAIVEMTIARNTRKEMVSVNE